jgi:GNAT superfamily N-acetyltransferase
LQSTLLGVLGSAHTARFAQGSRNLVTGTDGVTGMITIATIDEGDWARWRELRLAALEEDPEAFSTRLADWTGTGDTEERWRWRLATVPYNLIAYADGEPVGIVSATSPVDRAVTLISMWVAPIARGRGAGDALIQAVLSWARTVGASRVELAVRSANERAISLYVRNGFVDSGAVVDADESFPERRMETQLS